MLQIIANTENNPVNSKIIQQGEDFYVSSSVPIAGNSELIIFENTKPSILQFLEWSTNHNLGQILISYYDGVNYNPIGQVKNNGSGTDGFRPDSIATHGTSFFEINAFSNQSLTYKFSVNYSEYHRLLKYLLH